MAHYKLGIYGEPAVGKSVFSLGWPKPFFVCTDENYDFLDVFGAKENDHIQLNTWKEFKEWVNKFDFSKYETIVVDLIDDLYQWADAEYCRKSRIDDLGDIGYGKGYKVVRNDFTYYMLQLINKKCNIILLSHEDRSQEKTTKGTAYTAYAPSSYIPKKVWELINGKLRFFFRAYIEPVQTENGIEMQRSLSIRPKMGEFQINRGLIADSYPDCINLSYKSFVEQFGEPSGKGDKEYAVTDQLKPIEVVKNEPVIEPIKVEKVEKVEEVKTNPIIEKATKDLGFDKKENEEPKATKKTTKVKAEPKEETKTELKVETAAVTEVETKVEQPKVMTAAERIAAIKAKLGVK